MGASSPPEAPPSDLVSPRLGKSGCNQGSCRREATSSRHGLDGGAATAPKPVESGCPPRAQSGWQTASVCCRPPALGRTCVVVGWSGVDRVEAI
eukprot:scaffold5824_cov73-Phaeocystis_antarctica.AAC.6